MSSRLFYDCYAPYETYADTSYIEGDKTFGEIQNGDVLYILISDDNGYRFEELKVVYKWHLTHGHFYISCLKGKKKFNIDFGSSNCGNVINSKDGSIVFFEGYIIGTNKNSLYKYMYRRLTEDLEVIQKQFQQTIDKIEQLKQIQKL